MCQIFLPNEMVLRYVEVSQNGGPENGWLTIQHPLTMDNFGVPLFSETLIYATHRKSTNSRLKTCVSTRYPRVFEWISTNPKYKPFAPCMEYLPP